MLRLLLALYKCGINLMALLYFAFKSYPEHIALVDDQEELTYKQLWVQSEKLAIALKENYQIQQGQKVGLLCRNHASLIKAIFAVSRLGADLYFLNVEMSKEQLSVLMDRHRFDFIVYDTECGRFNGLSSQDINDLPQTNIIEKLPRTSQRKLVLFTGGTTGSPKTAVHQPSVFSYLHPFFALVSKLKLIHYQTAYIATPIYHGYGFAVLLLFIALGKKVVITRRFDPAKACSLICEHQVEVMTVVPLMVHKLLKQDVVDLRSLKCIASGGAELNPKLVEEVFNELGDVLYNLYGTSEAGLNMIATPQDLRYAASTIGKRIKGVRVKIVDSTGNVVDVGQVGQFYIQNQWLMKNREHSTIKTGDLGYRDEKGHYFWCGRVDDMVVSAGENVYPKEVEQVLITHPQVEDAAVIGVPDDLFGQRLRAYVVLEKNADLTKDELLQWLRARVARYQIPKEISFLDQLPYTPLGKRDKKRLMEK
ncbi:AMP-binding protein [Ammoniphilus resinae]|uniref:AMP-binding protein n=1 Tax=Ammoniphilus resinae TaxID=861532 RepID=UPI001FD7A1B6|nr:AMP-binding protein [Ammoniphilus resinae]